MNKNLDSLPITELQERTRTALAHLRDELAAELGSMTHMALGFWMSTIPALHPTSRLMQLPLDEMRAHILSRFPSLASDEACELWNTCESVLSWFQLKLEPVTIQLPRRTSMENIKEVVKWRAADNWCIGSGKSPQNAILHFVCMKAGL